MQHRAGMRKESVAMARPSGPLLAKPGGWRWVLKWALLLVLAVVLVLAIVYTDAANAAGWSPWPATFTPASANAEERWGSSHGL